MVYLSSVLPLLSILSFGIIPALGYPSSYRNESTSDRGVSFVLVGDSTTASYNPGLKSGGWGLGLCSSLENGTYCSNRAYNGRTTGTIVSGGNWSEALNDLKSEVSKGNIVFVTLQFGHNDQKIAQPSSMGANLTSFVHQIRDLGGYPILITPLIRRIFFNGTDTINDNLLPWAEETIAVAKNTSTPLLPLHEASKAYSEHIGNNASQLLDRSVGDTTHLNVAAQYLIGRLVADLMQIFVMNFPGVPKVKSPFITDYDKSLALYTGSQSVYFPVYPPGHNSTF